MLNTPTQDTRSAEATATLLRDALTDIGGRLYHIADAPQMAERASAALSAAGGLDAVKDLDDRGRCAAMAADLKAIASRLYWTQDAPQMAEAARKSLERDDVRISAFFQEQVPASLDDMLEWVAEMDFEDQVVLWKAVADEDAKSIMKETVFEGREQYADRRIVQVGLDGAPLSAQMAVVAQELDRLWAAFRGKTAAPAP